jgi:hypothetical protein
MIVNSDRLPLSSVIDIIKEELEKNIRGLVVSDIRGVGEEFGMHLVEVAMSFKLPKELSEELEPEVNEAKYTIRRQIRTSGNDIRILRFQVASAAVEIASTMGHLLFLSEKGEEALDILDRADQKRNKR